MGILTTIFGKNEDKATSKIDWINLTNFEQLELIELMSITKPVLIFKHSTRCSVSRMVLKQFENEFNLDDKIYCYFLDLLEFREISNEIVKRFRVIHQSPQVLVIKNKVAVYNASHESISADDLKDFVV